MTDNPAASRLFRKSALERLSTPDQLDQLVTVTGSWAWLATLFICALLAGVVTWSFLGAVPSYVAADGLIVKRGGTAFDIVAPADGRIDALNVTVGQQVARGDVIGSLDQAQLRLDLAQAQEVATERELHLMRLQEIFESERQVSAQLQSSQRRSLVAFRDAATERRAELRQTFEGLDRLGAKGLSTRAAVDQARAQFHQAEQEIRAASSDLIALDREANQLSARHARELLEAEESLHAAHREIIRLEDQLARSETLRADLSGEVNEIKAPVGTRIAKGQPILGLVRGETGLEAMVFLPPEKGKDVRAGQSVAVQPAHMKKEEFGAILGTVESVSRFPVSPERLRALLQNDNLVGRFSSQGAPYLARIVLQQDAGTASGLKWTSGQGPAVEISPGSVSAAEITVRERAPIDLVIPALRKFTGLGH